MKKIISSMLTIFVIVAIMFNIDLIAGAAVSVTTVKESHIKTVFDVNNYPYNTGSGTVTSTNLGGISVGAANNRLFAVKSNSGEEVATLYYYNNIYDSGFANGTKKPKRIVFTEGLLGHANAMAVDDDYIYVTMWQKNGSEKNSIIQISRKAISLLADEAVVSKTKKTVKDSNGDSIAIYKTFTPKYSDGKDYTKSIASITRYSYNKDAGITKFIIGYGYTSDRKTLNFTIATLQDGKFTVSRDYFVVNNSLGKSSDTMQDIFYDSAYGLLIPIWVSGTSNRVLCADIRAIKNNTSGETLTFDPYKILSVTKSKDNNGTLTQFEMESIAFVKRDENKNSIDFRLIFSCNKLKLDNNGKNVGCDAIEEITPLKTYLTKLT